MWGMRRPTEEPWLRPLAAVVVLFLGGSGCAHGDDPVPSEGCLVDGPTEPLPEPPPPPPSCEALPSATLGEEAPVAERVAELIELAATERAESRPACAVKIYGEAWRLDPQHDPALLLEAAEAALENGDCEGARELGRNAALRAEHGDSAEARAVQQPAEAFVKRVEAMACMDR